MKYSESIELELMTAEVGRYSIFSPDKFHYKNCSILHQLNNTSEIQFGEQRLWGTDSSYF